MIQILTAIAPLFLIILMSALLQKFKNIGDNWTMVLNDFALKIGLPILIFTALSRTPFSFSAQSSLIISNSVFILFSLLLAFVIGKMLRLEKKMFRTMFICFIFGNVAYLGIPVLTQISGDNILSTATIIVAIYLFWLFTIGIGYLEYSTEKNKKSATKNILKHLFTNPLFLSVIFGILVGSFNIVLPSILLKSLDMVTAAVTPTVLVVIGLFIGKSNIGKISEWLSILLFSLLKLLILPAIFYFGAKFSGFSAPHLSSSVIQSAMPFAITPFALADRYNLDKKFIARSIVLSTIFSVLSLSFWISIL